MKIINLFGAPGAGKSTGAAYIFAMLKMRGINAELVTEYAKDKVWENNEEAFKNQAYIFANQYFRISRLENKVDVVVTDSPLLLSCFYNKPGVLGDSFYHMVDTVFKSYDSLNAYLKRTKPYNHIGRLQNENESDTLSSKMEDFLAEYKVDYKIYTGDIEGYNALLEDILSFLN